MWNLAKSGRTGAQPPTRYFSFTDTGTHTNSFGVGCRHCSVDSSVPSILPPRVRLPSMPSTLFSIIVKFVLYLSMWCEKRTKINKKEAGFGPFLKNSFGDVETMNWKTWTHEHKSKQCNLFQGSHGEPVVVVVVVMAGAAAQQKIKCPKAKKISKIKPLICFRVSFVYQM